MLIVCAAKKMPQMPAYNITKMEFEEVPFPGNDKKKAMARLRGGVKHTSHHFSTFRTGMALGLAVPALVAGLYQSTWPF